LVRLKIFHVFPVFCLSVPGLFCPMFVCPTFVLFYFRLFHICPVISYVHLSHICPVISYVRPSHVCPVLSYHRLSHYSHSKSFKEEYEDYFLDNWIDNQVLTFDQKGFHRNFCWTKCAKSLFSLNIFANFDAFLTSFSFNFRSIKIEIFLVCIKKIVFLREIFFSWKFNEFRETFERISWRLLKIFNEHFCENWTKISNLYWSINKIIWFWFFK